MSFLDDTLAALSSNLAAAGLRLDPAMHARLLAIDGRSIAINSSLPPLQLFIVVERGTLGVKSTFNGKPNVAVSGSGMELANWLAAPHRIDNITIEGDETVLLEVTAALRAFDPDLLTPFTTLFGATQAQNILGGAELAVSVIRSAAEGVGQAIEKTVAAQFVSREDTGALLDVLDDLRLRIDRLAARIKAAEDPQQ
jgi:ubiquinone biosynthesis protein UbiJ